MSVFVLLPAGLGTVTGPSKALYVPVAVTDIVPGISMSVGSRPVTGPSNGLYGGVLVGVECPTFVSLSVSGFIFGGVIGGAPAGMGVAMNGAPVSFVSSFVGSGAAATDVVPPSEPVGGSGCQSAFLLGGTSVVPPEPMPVAPTDGPVVIVLDVVFSLLMLCVALCASRKSGVAGIVVWVLVCSCCVCPVFWDLDAGWDFGGRRGGLDYSGGSLSW